MVRHHLYKHEGTPNVLFTFLKHLAEGKKIEDRTERFSQSPAVTTFYRIPRSNIIAARVIESHTTKLTS